ncbi:hypothetical protein BY458DRAFT_493204 [Sporodiniella umbellata]|nr:hypothetical protein BY458DRAFT_493204 [Sporodiniella umbellata]
MKKTTNFFAHCTMLSMSTLLFAFQTSYFESSENYGKKNRYLELIKLSCCPNIIGRATKLVTRPAASRIGCLTNIDQYIKALFLQASQDVFFNSLDFFEMSLNVRPALLTALKLSVYGAFRFYFEKDSLRESFENSHTDTANQ